MSELSFSAQKNKNAESPRKWVLSASYVMQLC